MRKLTHDVANVHPTIIECQNSLILLFRQKGMLKNERWDFSLQWAFICQKLNR